MNEHLSGNVAHKFECYLVGPWECEELAPPPTDHLCHVEPSEEGDWDETTEPSCIDAQQLKVLSEVLILKEDCPVITRDFLALVKDLLQLFSRNLFFMYL